MHLPAQCLQSHPSVDHWVNTPGTQLDGGVVVTEGLIQLTLQAVQQNPAAQQHERLYLLMLVMDNVRQRMCALRYCNTTAAV